ncbi:hypothetical protein PV516_19170 [Streptomyces scabiei]|uniref:hypothetical protein n=1 Tax=Streptomyces scabiei TaxID=1930 RepID=UPI0029BEC467|nr:hypothetical protein [Streptomyces scabiei]MDX3165910.1 hypothetical protein [Streptomyces scabiei]
MSVLEAVALGLLVCAIAGALTGRLAYYRTSGLVGVANLMGAAHAASEGNVVATSITASLGLALAWIWWKGGGNDDTRRGRRRLRRLFTPARRTAPAPS